MVRQRLAQLADSLKLFRESFVDAGPVYDQLVAILDLFDGASRDADGSAWESLPNVMERTGLSRSYFAVPIQNLGGKRRLDIWKEKGLAKKEGTIWFLSSALELPKRHREVAPDPPRPAEDRTEQERTYELMQSNRRKGN